MAERSGAEQSRALEAQLAGERFMIDAGELQASEQAIQEARAARTEAVGQLAGGVGNAVGASLTGGLSGSLFSKKTFAPQELTQTMEDNIAFAQEQENMRNLPSLPLIQFP
jgi:hypothetical protein